MNKQLPSNNDSIWLNVRNSAINFQNNTSMLLIMYISILVLFSCIILIYFLDTTHSTGVEYVSNIMSFIIIFIICLRIFIIYPNMTYFKLDNQTGLFYEYIGIISVFALLLIFYFMTKTNTPAQWGLTIATIIIVFFYLHHLLKVTNKMFPNVEQKIIDVSNAYKYFMMLILFLSFVLTFYFSNFQKNPTTSLIIVSVLCGLYLAYVARYMYGKLFPSIMASVGLICMMLVFLYNPYNIVSQLSSIMIFGTIFIIISLIIAIAYYFGLYSGDTVESIQLMSNFKNISMVVIGIGVFCSIIAYLVTTFDSKTGGKGKLILNILILTGILSIIFNALNNSGFVQSHPSLRLFVNTILYVPCLLTNLIELFTKEYYLTTSPTVIVIIIEILLVCIYFAYPYVVNKIYVTSHGKLLINEPYDLSKPNNVSSYDELNANNNNIQTTNKYSDSNNKPVPNTPDIPAQTSKYSLSCWVFINAMSPSTNTNYPTYMTILDYGQKPSILYNPSKNELIVTTLTNQDHGGELPTKDSNSYTTSPSDYTVVYKNSNPPLQKWNNIVLNVDGGTLDVFFNGELVQSSINITPNLTQDLLTVGSENGLSGGICNLEYFENPLNIININYLYNLLKNSDPPIVPSKLKLFDYKI